MPATVQSGEYGIVAAFLKNRISVDATFFRNRDYNNFVNVPNPKAAALTSVLKNANEYIRRGWNL